MKSAKSYFNQPLFKDLLKRHWWFGFINLIVLFFAIPINFLLTAQRFTRNDITPEAILALHKYVASFFSFSVEGTIVTIIVAMFSALVAGLVFFSYLHRKDQVNFFHSQPVSRECLFTIRIAAAVLLFIVPYIINIGIALIIAAITGVISEVGWIALIGQMGYVLMVFTVSYAIVVLAGILCGTLATQAEMTIILVFAPLLVYTSIVMLCQRFYDTYYADFFFQKVIYFSPVTHLVAMVSGEAAVTPLVILTYIALIAVALVLALWLYLKRPSEGTGMSLIFPISRPLVKYVCCFIAAVLMGVFFDELGGFGFMIFGFVMGLLLCSLFTEAQFNRDFKAMFKNMKGLAVFGLGFALFVTAIAYDVTGYDSYQPEAAKVKAVSFTWNDGDVRPIFNTQRHYQQRDMNHLTFTTPQVKNEVLAIVENTLKSGNFAQKKPYSSQFDFEDRRLDSGVNNRTITIIYELNSGRQVARRYTDVSIKPVKDQVQQIISSEEYKSKHGIMQMADSVPANVMIEPADTLNSDYRIAKSTMNPVQIDALVAAIKTDVKAVGATVDNQVVYTVSCDSKEFNARLNIYENYGNTIALINQMASADDFQVNNELAKIKTLEIRPITDPEAKPLVLDQPVQIEQVIKISRSNWGDAMTIADDYVVTIPPTTITASDPYMEKMMARDADGRVNRYFVIGKVPEFVQAGMQ